MRWISWVVVVLSFPLAFGLAWWWRDGCDVGRVAWLVAGIQLAIAIPAAFLGGMTSGRSVGGAALRAAAVFALSAVVVVAVLPRVPGSVERARMRRAAVELREVARATAVWAREHAGRYPVATDVNALSAALGTRVAPRDPWGNPWQVACDGAHCSIASLGACGEPEFVTPDQIPEGETDDVHADLVARDGRLVRRPAGFLP